MVALLPFGGMIESAPFGLNPMLLSRSLSTRLLNSFDHSPVVFLSGARQSGKSTLVGQLAKRMHQAEYYTFDDAHTLDLALADPQTFVESLKLPAIIDEVQLVDKVARAIKLVVDRSRKPGMFLLTGSASVMVLPKLSEALVGRMDTHTLYPFSQGELAGIKEDFLKFVFDGRLKMSGESSVGKAAKGENLKSDLADRILRGGFPVVALQDNAAIRKEWFGSYLSDVIRREVRQMSDIDRLNKLPSLLAHVASSMGGLLNVTDLAGRAAIPAVTLSRYLTLLNAAYLVGFVKPWSMKLTNTITKSPKVYMLDTGLAGYVLTLDKSKLLSDGQAFGRMLENFVYAELLKQTSWSALDCELFHFRTRTGIEVDFIVKDQDGRLVALEIKASTSVTQDDFRGINYFASHFKQKFTRGVVLYCGDRLIAFGDNKWAMPVSMLWEH
jgi:predicted AAA+ superfamily ATPase